MSYIARFTSSEIHRLMSDGRKKGEPGLPYHSFINEKRWEAEMGRPLDTSDGGKATAWGLVCERYVLEHLLGMEYVPMMDEAIIHPVIPLWSGKPDAMNTATQAVVELKCPFTLTSFCGLAEPIKRGLSGIDAMRYIRDNHKDGEKYYWQCVSNCILTGAECVEFMFFMPTEAHLDDIRHTVQQFPLDMQYKFYWLENAHNSDLPYLIKESKYESMYKITFVPPEEDIKALTGRVLMAIDELRQPYYIVHND